MPEHLPTHLLPETVVKLLSAAAAAALALVLTGCSTVVEFTSDIEGARVTRADGTTAGITPVQVTFDNDALDAARGADGFAESSQRFACIWSAPRTHRALKQTLKMRSPGRSRERRRLRPHWPENRPSETSTL